MTDQTGNDRYAGTRPARQSQEQAPMVAGDMMEERKQAGVQMDQQPTREDQESRRKQAGEQSDKGFGYGAQDGEEMADAPDASERGYGGAAKEREEKLDDSE
ncbi:hypothetical protein [Aurantiacibacter rhizosphaerae]|nr:hypothetical protein [Aurantiacibacter rhizosphaerae]